MFNLNLLTDVKYIITSKIYQYITRCYYSWFFKSIGKKSRIVKPLRLINTKNICIGDKVDIGQGVFLLTEKLGSDSPNLILRSKVKIGHYCHITCVNYLEIKENVLIADRVYISDNYHIYNDHKMPIMHQGVGSKGPTVIGENTWIGEGAAIISSNIGKNCVIGANSVVIKDIPDYSVAVGSPAKVVKRYNEITQKWESVSFMIGKEVKE